METLPQSPPSQHEPVEEPLQIRHVIQLPDPRDVLVRAQDDHAAPDRVDVVVLVRLPVALVVALVVDVHLPVVPSDPFPERMKDLVEVGEQLDLAARGGMDDQHLDDRVDGRAGGCVAVQDRVGLGQRLAQGPDARGLIGPLDVAGEDDQAPAAVAPEALLEVPGPRVGLVEDLEAGHAHPHPDDGREVLLAHDLRLLVARRAHVGPVALARGVAGLRDDQARAVVDRDAAGEQVALLEDLLELLHADAFLVHDVLGGSAREEARELVVEGDQILRDAAPFGLICLEDRGVGDALDDVCDLPAEVVCLRLKMLDSCPDECGISWQRVHLLSCILTFIP